MVFLHGVLDVHIQKATNLANLDSCFLRFNKKDVSDPYVCMTLHTGEGEQWDYDIATTSIINNNLNPVWDQRFFIDLCHESSAITFTVWDKDLLSSDVIGSTTISAGQIVHNTDTSGAFKLGKDGKNSGNGVLHFSMTYYDKGSLPNKDSFEVPSCLFPLRSNCNVTLYQDTHCKKLPVSIENKDGGKYEPRSTWRDIHTAITEAKLLIYIVGWSVSVKTVLLRDEGDDNRTLGEILKEKSYQGVKVKLLLWDEMTSTDMKKGGAMNTEDNYTHVFFKGTNVDVFLQARDVKAEDIMATSKKPFTNFCFTHHQKTVVVDAPIEAKSDQRKLVAFVGGLDLTGGRYDTCEHPLFRTLVHEHENDFRNRMLPTLTSKSGPRQPWHDIHSRIEGPAALDVLNNFAERWKKSGKCFIAPLEKEKNLNMNFKVTAKDSWNVQMFRSINSDSLDFNIKNAEIGFRADIPVLKFKRGGEVDDSLHRAYLHNIRKARRFIYIENQYFMGSRHMWSEHKEGKSGNLIPLEIAIKIEEKIRDGERFTAYILIPMFPEGQPEAEVTQEILHKQVQTMRMMYGRIATAIKWYKVDAHPQDYLVFLCLANKEPPTVVPKQLQAPPEPENTLAFHNRRNMIYVHSKMAIFDDEYAIIGSANINDRSMSGSRDSEIAVGVYQPSYTAEGSFLSTGHVGQFRRALWAEHFGESAPVDVWDDPASLDCVKKVQALAEASLRAYITPGDHATPHHIMIYPLQV
ncbi:unnamed protein product, partial [Meganyctiphanes norvegica]